MGLRFLVPTTAFYPAPLPTQRPTLRVNTLSPAVSLPLTGTRCSSKHCPISSSTQLLCGKTDVPRQRKGGDKPRRPTRQIQGFCRGVFLREQRLPRSKVPVWKFPDNRKTALRQALNFSSRFVLELFLATSVFSFASVHFLERSRTHFILTNLTRWTAASLSIKLIMFQSRITPTVPSQARGESTDWFLHGSYRILSDGCGSGEPTGKHVTTTECVPPSIPVKIRQVPGNGSCLFHSIAAGILFNESASNERSMTLPADLTAHPPMSKVVDYSSTLRAQAVEVLSHGFDGNESTAVENLETELSMQNGKTISTMTLVGTVATQYGMTPAEYLSTMRQENVWGGGPEIVALSNFIERPIVLLEPTDTYITEGVGEEQKSQPGTIYLKTAAQFGPSGGKPIHILSTNQQFPVEYHGMIQNHFLAVFPID